MSCLILGTGYVGKYYLKKYPDCAWTSRREQVGNLKFDLLDKETWSSLRESPFKNVLWTFAPASSPDEELKSLELFNEYFKDKNVLVYSSTSAYVFKVEDELVDESYPLRIEEPRFRCEEKLRENGAMIVHLSGIIGTDRYPRKWYERNWVKHGQNVLNYIHVDDIVSLTAQLFEKFTPGERFNLTSSDYKRHAEIVSKLGMNVQFEDNTQTSGSKRVPNDKVLKHLDMVNYSFIKYPEDCQEN